MTSTVLPPRLRDFLAHIERRGPDECWPWTGSMDGSEQPRFSLDGKWTGVRRMVASMRFGWWLRPRSKPRHRVVRHVDSGTTYGMDAAGRFFLILLDGTWLPTEPLEGRLVDVRADVPGWDERPQVRLSCGSPACCNPAHFVVKGRTLDEWDAFYAEHRPDAPGALDR